MNLLIQQLSLTLNLIDALFLNLLCTLLLLGGSALGLFPRSTRLLTRFLLFILRRFFCFSGPVLSLLQSLFIRGVSGFLLAPRAEGLPYMESEDGVTWAGGVDRLGSEQVLEALI